MAEVFEVTRREAFGSQNTRRLRRDGQIPAILYGHGKENVPLAIPAEQVQNAVRVSAKLIGLEGAVQESALIREVQWDALGDEIIHLDLTRVSATELVQVDVGVETRGTAPGIADGGVIKVLVHTVSMECRADSIPEKLEININQLELNGSLTVADIQLPDGVTVLLPEDSQLVQCVEASSEEDDDDADVDTEAATGAAEPEIIGRKDEEGDAEQSEDN